jgi:uncharacterized protein (DUF433 family)
MTSPTGKRPRVLLSDAMLDDIAKRYRAGETILDLRKAFGCSSDPIRNALKQRGVAIRRDRRALS